MTLKETHLISPTCYYFIFWLTLIVFIFFNMV